MLGWPGGQVIVAIAGLVLIGVGLYQGYKGVRKKFLEKSKTEEMSETTEKVFTALGVAGHLARMVVFALIGYFLIKAAIDFDPDKAVSARRRARRSGAGCPTGRSCWASWRRAWSPSRPTRSPTHAIAASDWTR